jgi:hypothetical protein
VRSRIGWAALAALAACYRPASDRCGVVGTECVDPGGGDAARDTPVDMDIDGPPSPDACVMPTHSGSDTAFTQVFGTYFVGVFGGDFPAAMLKANITTGSADVVVQLGQSFTNTYKIVVPGANADVLVDAPRLAPNGLEIFLRVDHPSSGKSELMVTRRAVNDVVWSVPKGITIDGQSVFSNISVPSPPTTTSPRRMIVSQGAGLFEEVKEQGTDGLTWTVVQRVDAPSFGVNYSGEPSLTADGRFLVFRGNTGGLNQALYVPRDANGKFTGTGTALLGPISSVNEPYLAPDCTHLFYTDQPAGQVHMVTY